jgi:hypothetical protein
MGKLLGSKREGPILEMDHTQGHGHTVLSKDYLLQIEPVQVINHSKGLLQLSTQSLTVAYECNVLHLDVSGWCPCCLA